MGCSASISASKGVATQTSRPPGTLQSQHSDFAKHAAGNNSATEPKNKLDFVRHWVDATPGDPSRPNSHASRMSISRGTHSRAASSRGASRASLRSLDGPSGSTTAAVCCMPRIPLEFSDPAYSKLLQRKRLEEDYDIDMVKDDRDIQGLFYLVSHRATGEVLQCRTVDKARLQDVPEELMLLQAEVEVMHALAGCPGAVQLHALYEDGGAYHLVMDHCAGGDLFDLIAAAGRLSEPLCAVVVAQVVTTVSRLHRDKGIMHRDICLENIFLERALSQEARRRSGIVGAVADPAKAVVDYAVKVGGFASATFFVPGQRFGDIVGSNYYMAPEVLRRNHSSQADVWSIGVLLYMMLVGQPPFNGETEMEIFTNVMSGSPDFQNQLWADISPEAIALTQAMINYEPLLRPSFDQLLEHPWMVRMLGM